MTETEVPDDLMKVAEETLDLMLCECSESCGGTDGLRRESIATLASALASERERATLAERAACAEIARDDDGHFTWAGEDRHVIMLQQCAREIAEAILARP